MQLIREIEKSHLRELPEIRPGDTVRVHLKIREGGKERIQAFEGLVIRRRRGVGIGASITVRRIASGVGVERTFLLHSPLISRIQVTGRGKVRRAYLSYMRGRRGRSGRLQEQRFERVDIQMAGKDQKAGEEIPATDTSEQISASAPAESAESAEPAGGSDNVSEAAPADSTKTPEPEQVSDAEVTEVSEDSAAATEPETEDTDSIEEIATVEEGEAKQSAEDSSPDENEVAREATEEGASQAGSTDAPSPAEKEDLA